MPSSSLRERLAQSRLAQALVVYLGAAWVIIEVAGALQEALELPAWVTPVAIILLAIGLLVVLATAWVQSNPQVDAREASGEVPDSWEVGLADLGRSLRRGRIPHLTWARALVGGLFAFWLLFGFAGVLVLLRDGDGGWVGEAAADQAAVGLAVMPFSVSGADPDVFREGMATLLATTLDGAAGVRAVDSRTVLARWREHVREGSQPELATVLDVGRATGARYVLVGSAVAAGQEVALVAELLEADGGRELATVRSQGPPDSLMALVDRLSVEVTRAFLAEGLDGSPRVQHLASLTTSSLPALLAYLQGESHYRTGRFEEALEAYERAVAADSTFALASLRASQVYGWNDGGSPARVAHREQAERMAERLPARERMLLDGLNAMSDGDPAGIRRMEEAVRRFPDDADLWNALGEIHAHAGAKALAEPAAAAAALQRAADLQPDFAPYLIHLTEYHLSYGDSAAAARWLERERALAPDANFHRAHRLVFQLLHGDSAASAAALDSLAGPGSRPAYVTYGLRGPDRLAARERLWRRVLRDQPTNPRALFELGDALLAQGKVGEARALLDLPGTEPFHGGFTLVLHSLGYLDAAALDPAAWQGDLLGQAMFAALREDWSAWDQHRAAADTLLQGLQRRDSLQEATMVEAFILMVDGVAAWQRGRLDDAVSLLGRVLPRIPGGNEQLVLWQLAQVHEERGDEHAALRHYRAAFREGPQVSLARLRAARLHERLGQTEEALQAYRGFLVAWADADPELQPLLEEARAAVLRLAPPG